MNSIYQRSMGKKVKSMEEAQKFNREITHDHRADILYPGMAAGQEVLDAVESMRDDRKQFLNDLISNDAPATEQELAVLSEKQPWLNLEDPIILHDEIKRFRQGQMLYGFSGNATRDEIELAKNDYVSQSLKAKLESAADAYHAEHGTWTGWDERRLEIMQEMSTE